MAEFELDSGDAFEFVEGADGPFPVGAIDFVIEKVIDRTVYGMARAVQKMIESGWSLEQINEAVTFFAEETKGNAIEGPEDEVRLETELNEAVANDFKDFI